MKNGIFVAIALLACAAGASAQTASDATLLNDIVVEVPPVRPLRPLQRQEPRQTMPVETNALATLDPVEQLDAVAELETAAESTAPGGTGIASNSIKAMASATLRSLTNRVSSGARVILSYRLERMDVRIVRGVLASAAALLVVSLVRARRTARRKPAPKRAPPAAEAVEPRPAAAPRDPERARTDTKATVWAAKTLAGTGLDAAAIARRTGLARDATLFLVSRARPNVPVPAASSPSTPGGAVGRTVALQS